MLSNIVFLGPRKPIRARETNNTEEKTSSDTMSEICDMNCEDYKNKEPLSFLKFFFNCCYYTCFVPFRVVWNSKLNRFILVRHKGQWILCGGFHIFYIVYTMFSSFYRYNRDIFKVRPLDSSFVNAIFSGTCNFTLQIFYYLLIKSAWFDKQAIEDMINSIGIHSLSGWEVLRINKMLKVVGMVGFIAVASFHGLNAEFSLKLDERRLGNETWLGAPIKSWLDWYIVWFIIDVQMSNFSFVNHLFLFVLSCGLATMAWEVEEDLEKVGESVKKGIDLYRNLKRKINLVNKAWSGKFLAFAIVLISYYGTLPDILMQYIAEEPFVSIFVYAVVNTVGWVVAANFPMKVQRSFLRWTESRLYDNLPGWKGLENEPHDIQKFVKVAVAFDDQLKLSALRNEIQNEPIALSCDFFLVTNSFLCSILSLIVTYSVIIFQTRTN